MKVWLSSQHIDVSIHLVNILKRLINIGCDEEAVKYGCGGRVAFDLGFGELRHYFMTLEHDPHNCGGLFHSGGTQIYLPRIQARYNFSKIYLSWLDKRESFFFWGENPWHGRMMISAYVWVISVIMKLYVNPVLVRPHKFLCSPSRVFVYNNLLIPNSTYSPGICLEFYQQLCHWSLNLTPCTCNLVTSQPAGYDELF